MANFSIKHFLQIFWHVSVDVRNGLKHDLLYLPLYKHLVCSKKKKSSHHGVEGPNIIELVQIWWIDHVLVCLSFDWMKRMRLSGERGEASLWIKHKDRSILVRKYYIYQMSSLRLDRLHLVYCCYIMKSFQVLLG